MGTHPIFESDFDCLTGKWGLSVRIKMSDTEGAAPAPVAAPAAGQYSVETAVQETLKHAQHRDGLSRGLNEAVRALERKDALCCILAENCDEQTTSDSSRPSASNTKSQFSRLVITRHSANGPDFAKLTEKVTQSRLLAAHALSFAKSTIMLLGITSKTT